MTVVADLHNHSCLSPCGSLEHSPRFLAESGRTRGINVMALTDHNSAANCRTFSVACAAAGLTPLFGAEVTSLEEVHVLSLFGSLDAAEEWGAHLYSLLPDAPNRPELFGDQVAVDYEEQIIDVVEKHLIPAVSLGLSDIVAETHRRGGLSIPAHIDRSTTSVGSQLGFVPDDPFDALEITRWPPELDTRGLPLICSSDAHYPDDIGRRTIRYHVDAMPRTSEEAIDQLHAALQSGTVQLSIARESGSIYRL